MYERSLLPFPSPLLVLAVGVLVVAGSVMKGYRRRSGPDPDGPTIGPPAPGPATKVLREVHDENGSQVVWVTPHLDGRLEIRGQDLGSGVSDFWGAEFKEYEYSYTVAASDVPSLVAALGSADAGTPDDDVVELLRRYLREPGAVLGQLLGDRGRVPAEFWSRVGE
jgi:hypothetical protein